MAVEPFQALEISYALVCSDEFRQQNFCSCVSMEKTTPERNVLTVWGSVCVLL